MYIKSDAISLIKIVNMKGLRTEPYGTPENWANVADLTKI